MQDGHQEAAQTSLPSLLIRRVGLDDFSTVRHIHTSAVRALAERLLDPKDVTLATQAIYSPAYISELVAKSVFVAALNGDLVATCAWSPSDDRGIAARISALFVAPLFQGIGIARQLITHVEQDANHNGFERFTATVPVSITPLFEALGYVTASFGTSRDVVPETALQVAFLRKPD